MSVTAAQVQRVGAGAGTTASCQVIATAINDASGIEPDVLTANSVLYAVTSATPAALSVAASRVVGRKASGNVSAMTAAETLTVLGFNTTAPTELAAAVPNTRTISTTAPLTGGGDLSANRTLAIPAATNAVDGYSTAAQVTAQEAASTRVGELRAGIGASPDSPASGAISLTTATTFLTPAGNATFTLAAGTLGQHKWAILGATFDVTITEVSGWTGKAQGDYVHACYTGGGWIALDSRATP